jgi:hypothetical protein
MARTSVYHDLQRSLSQNDAIYLQSKRVAKISQICLASHRTRNYFEPNLQKFIALVTFRA